MNAACPIHRSILRPLMCFLLAAGALSAVPGWIARTEAQTVALKRYDTKYYVIWSDLDADHVREATLRVTQMAEEYHARTRGFAGTITQRLPFYLFDKAADYVASGGPPGTAGVFMGDKLMAIAGEDAGGYTWHTVQHEGFHQFVHAVISGDIPIWANEGLAEYFGEALWTGDEFVSGIIPPDRLARLQARIKNGSLKSLEEMMLLPHAVWNAEGKLANYDQAWSMIHFLAHADNGKYQKPFNSFLRMVSDGERWQEAWRRSFGSDVQAFENRWRAYWTEMPPNPTAEAYSRATAATLAGFMGRAHLEHQRLDSWDDFVATARAKGLKVAAENWLPPALLDDAIARSQRFGTWSVERKTAGNWVVCELDDGTKLTGSFRVHGTRFAGVDVKVVPPRKARSGDKPEKRKNGEKGGESKNSDK